MSRLHASFHSTCEQSSRRTRFPLALTIVALLGSAAAGAQSSFYVSPTGNDSTGDGSMSAPFATLTRAQTAMRGSSTIKTTQILSGTYQLTTPLALTSSDNGETWEAASGATPVISGGVSVTGWTSVGGGIWSAPLSVSPGTDLEIGGARQMPAVLGFDPLRPYMTGWHVINSAVTGSGTTLNVFPADITSSAQKTGAILQFMLDSRYTDYFGAVTAWNVSAGTITTNTTQKNVSNGSWRILGDYQDISAPGQFGYDASGHNVYVYPVSGCSFNASSVAMAAQLTALITINNVSDLTITGLTFRDTVTPRTGYTEYGGIDNTNPTGTIQGTKLINSSISSNTFTNIGNGIALTSSTGNTFSYNTFDQVGSAPYLLKTQSNNNTVQYNTMTAISQIAAGAPGVYIGDSASVTVDSNYLNGSGNHAVHYELHDQTSTTNLAITNNTFINANKQTQDTAVIYGYAGRYSTPTNIASNFSGNRIENSGGLGRSDAGVWGFGLNRAIYMDKGVSGVTLTDNVTENNSQAMLLCSGCTGNAASNNVAIMQSAPTFTNAAGTSNANGSMTTNGTISINSLPSYFPTGVSPTVIVLQAVGASTGGISPAFNILADGSTIGSGSVTPDGNTYQFTFTTALTSRQMHTLGVQLTNGVTSGSPTQSLSGLILYVNDSVVSLAAGSEYGAQILGTPPNISDFSYSRNIVYRLTGSGADMNFNFSPGSYTDPNPGTIDYNLIWQSLSKGPNTYGYTSDAHSVISDPLFNSVSTGDYTLNTSSPAFGLGFNSTGVPLAPLSSYPTSPVTACSVYANR